MYPEHEPNISPPPGWQFLRYLPYFGKRWLERITAYAADPSVMAQEDEPSPTVKPVDGIEKFILLQEGFEHSTGDASDVTVIPLNKREVEFFDFLPTASSNRNSAQQVKASAVRERKNSVPQPLAKLQSSNGKYTLTNLQGIPLPILSKDEKGNVKARYIKKGAPEHSLKSGERFIVGFSEFEFIELPTENNSRSTQPQSF